MRGWNFEGIFCNSETPMEWAFPLAVRRFPPTCSVEETDACFIVRDANGQALAYVYFEDRGSRDGGPLS
jgi:hypothetical protein